MSEDPVDDFASTAIERAVVRRSADGAPEALPMRAAEAAFTAARAAFAGSLRVPCAFSTLVERACLTTVEAETLALAVGIERSDHLQRLVVSLTGERDRHRVEVGMLGDVLGPEHAAAAGPDSAVQRAALLELEPAGAFGRTALAVPGRVMWALIGDRRPDPSQPHGVEWISAAASSGDNAIIVIGRDRIRRRQTAAALLPRSIAVVVPAPSEPTDRAWAAVVREATIAGAAVVVELEGPPDPVAHRWIERADHLAWVLSCPTPIDLSRAAPRLPWRLVEAPDAEPSDDEWSAALGPEVPRTHRLSAEQLHQMHATLPATGGDFDATLRRMVSPKMDTLATHVRPTRGWDDLILSPGRKALVADLIARYRNAHLVYDEWGVPADPSRGLVALFSGPSGPGKTLAAEVVAKELGLDLYRLDLSSVVSKWIGETEKNLDQLFAAAGAGNFVLFFDEADTLFARRSEVSDSHDRYANIETSYLLQRLERYEGVVVLATNYEKNIDHAFMRRIHVRVDFVLPDEAARLAIWRHHAARGPRPAADVDLADFAKRFELPGAAIRNAIVDAAFLAAGSGADELDRVSLVRGVAREMRKLGRLVTAAQFGDWFALVDDSER